MSALIWADHFRTLLKQKGYPNPSVMCDATTRVWVIRPDPAAADEFASDVTSEIVEKIAALPGRSPL